MQAFKDRIQSRLKEREEQGLSRRLTALSGANSSDFQRDGKQYLNFSSNDYLGLATEPSLVSAWQQGLSLYGAGSAASPLITGFSDAHCKLEETLCEWLGFDRAILFSSGFSANQAVLFSLLEKDDLLIQDKLNHASLVEAGMLSPASMKRFRHNDIDHLNSLVDPSKSTLVVTEGVFSMDGDLSPLSCLAEKAELNNVALMVDDAHGIGVLGEEGRGSCEYAGIKPDILVVTFGKAPGLSGAAVMCNANLGDYFTQFARHHVYSTAMPPSQAHALTHSVSLMRTQQWRREKLAELSDAYDEALADLPGFVHTDTPIKPFLCGEAEVALDVAHNLREQGIWVTAIRPPTVPKGQARLRITLTANHSIADLAKMANKIKQVVASRVC
ncbi:8-amino-7-oxononanoate synthase [Vibrio nigripulchritudo SO65]|uniref:8-amino-7-oxononanoate synthase n=1 Tax=Vibrio nigripulchritudo TaxID=28173 RepID=UPI0003B1F1D0|nr:8-amino-7-oxononanoate synthase [Vibrio nigripulchritudo]CCN37437.1 8-amino-7-oxononanoate synthase [Vibrio nigripulchritudo AM115]CCN42534.1 8-amino-7-oxononanoate synthase [Vibrio nigripulchritudo FTn2]CCN63843.1 8-amino-7-oxononanoate synthase [Vibrio nigripulchritudo POn4]CCN78820.1 8-amino-7-oxononanoate synthase [Vibrio nigripulchritudo SO65]